MVRGGTEDMRSNPCPAARSGASAGRRRAVWWLGVLGWVLAAWVMSGCTNSGSKRKTPNRRVECGRLTVINASGTGCKALTAISTQSRDVIFESKNSPGGKIKLRGRLTYPKWGAGPQPAKALPGIVLVGSSGPLSRDGAMKGDLSGDFKEPVLVLRDVAEGLAQRGYAVLTYDKRTCTSAVNPSCSYTPEQGSRATWEDLVGDVLAGASFLSGQPDVDDGDIILVGHGQGATVALEAASQDVNITDLVLLAGTFRPVDQMLVDQVRWQIDNTKMNAREKKEAEKELSTIQSMMLAIKEEQLPDEERFMNATAKFWRSYIEATRKTGLTMKRLDNPVFYLRGDADNNANTREETGFKRSMINRPNSEAKTLQGVNHALTRAGEPRVARDVTEAVADWLGRPRVINLDDNGSKKGKKKRRR